jgi:hypothetical protein
MHISCSNFFFRKSLRLCDNTEKCGRTRQATDCIIRSKKKKRHARYIIKAKIHTHSLCVAYYNYYVSVFPQFDLPWNMILVTSMISVETIEICLKSDQNIGHFYMTAQVFHIAVSDICSTTINITHFCFSIVNMVTRTRHNRLHANHLPCCKLRVLWNFSSISVT